MGHVILNTGACSNVEVPVSDTAAKLVRFKFNPSQLPTVDRVKSLMAATISMCESIRDDPATPPEARREAAVAITHVQTASMFAVAAATPHLS